MALQFKKAQRSQAYVKVGVSAASGAGKTLGMLLMAYGMMKEKYPGKSDAFLWEKIAVIDTENGSGELYVGAHVEKSNLVIGEYNVVAVESPFTADKYINAIDLCEQNGVEVGIIDSASHMWEGTGGMLDKQNAVAKRSGNSYTAWRDVTPDHNRFVEKMLQCKMHLFVTMRAKQEYVQEKDSNGKTVVRKLGMAPIQRTGMEYEFTLFLEINAEHEAFGAKDRTSIFDQRSFIITPKDGGDLMKWLNSGAPMKEVEKTLEIGPAESKAPVVDLKEEVIALCKQLGGSGNPVLMEHLVKVAPPKGNPNSLTDTAKIKELHTFLSEMISMKNEALS